MNILSVAAFSMVASLAVAASAFAQTPSRQAPPTQGTNATDTAPTPGAGTNAGNPGYPMQGGGLYEGPPGKGAVVNDDHRYNRT